MRRQAREVGDLPTSYLEREIVFRPPFGSHIDIGEHCFQELRKLIGRRDRERTKRQRFSLHRLSCIRPLILKKSEPPLSRFHGLNFVQMIVVAELHYHGVLQFGLTVLLSNALNNSQCIRYVCHNPTRI